MKYWVCSSTKNLQPQVDLLRESVEKHMPEHKFVHVDPPVLVPGMHIYQQAEIARVNQVIRLLMNGAEEVITSGADYLVYSPLKELYEAKLGASAVLLCPHYLRSFPPVEKWLVPAIDGGHLNSDFQVWRPGPRVLEFLTTLVKLNMHQKSPFLGQHVLSHATTMLGAEIIMHPGYGVSYYNLHERKLGPLGEVYLLDEDGPVDLRTMHFSGLRFHEGANPITEFIYPFKRNISQEELGIFSHYQEAVRAKRG